ncbi:MAG TPA: hypothetical protein VMN60_05250 [Longimicrobiales bacterium]|nr:hypothetical protein [Longimicrobiales bacterium]
MNRSAIERLLESRMIEAIQADDDEVVGLWRKAIESCGDSEVGGMSRDGVFKLLYDAGRQAATAFVAAHGYRAKGASGHHHSVLAAAAALASESHADFFKQMDLQRGRRHEIEYSAYSEIDAEDIEELRGLVRSLINETAAALRKVRPSIKQRIRKVR